MGKKGNWFSAVKKALNPEPKEKNSDQETRKSKKKWFRRNKNSDPNSTPEETIPSTTATTTTTTLPPPPPPVLPPPIIPPSEPAKLSGAENEQTKYAYTVALATAKAAEAAVAAAQAAAEVVRLTTAAPQFSGKSKEEAAAIKIQTAFRGYMARRALRALRGLLRLKTVMQGQPVKRQTANTLKSMQTLARVQSQVRERRLKLAEENQAIRRQLQEKRAKELAKGLDNTSQQSGDDWNSSVKSKEQIEAKLQSKHEAAIRRERTLAYAFTHQQTWKSSAMSGSTLFMDSNNPHWGWSWLERWLAARPWETATTPEKLSSNDNSPRTKTSQKATISGNHEITKSYPRHHKAEKPSPTISVQKQTPRSSDQRLSTSSATSKTARNLRSLSPKASPRASIVGGLDEDARSVLSVHSEQSRRHSVTVVRDDDESLTSSQTAPSYMAPTESTKVKSRLGSQALMDKSVTPDRLSVSSVKKRLSYSGGTSPVRSRRSASPIGDASATSEHT